jgi:hypothetical protein
MLTSHLVFVQLVLQLVISIPLDHLPLLEQEKQLPQLEHLLEALLHLPKILKVHLILLNLR